MRSNNFCENFPHDNSKAPGVVLVHNYHNVSVVSQGSNAHFESTIKDPLEKALLQYFRGTPKETEKLKIMSFAEKIFTGEDPYK